MSERLINILYKEAAQPTQAAVRPPTPTPRYDIDANGGLSPKRDKSIPANVPPKYTKIVKKFPNGTIVYGGKNGELYVPAGNPNTPTAPAPVPAAAASRLNKRSDAAGVDHNALTALCKMAAEAERRYAVPPRARQAQADYESFQNSPEYKKHKDKMSSYENTLKTHGGLTDKEWNEYEQTHNAYAKAIKDHIAKRRKEAETRKRVIANTPKNPVPGRQY